MDSFRKLLLIRSWCPDRTIAQAKMYIEGNEKPLGFQLQRCYILNKIPIKQKHYSSLSFTIFHIEESLGPEYSEMQILDLEATWQESEPRTPLVCLLSIGSDPTTQIGQLAKQNGIGNKTNYLAFFRE